MSYCKRKKLHHFSTRNTIYPAPPVLCLLKFHHGWPEKVRVLLGASPELQSHPRCKLHGPRSPRNQPRIRPPDGKVLPGTDSENKRTGHTQWELRGRAHGPVWAGLDSEVAGTFPANRAGLMPLPSLGTISGAKQGQPCSLASLFPPPPNPDLMSK